MRPYLNWVTDHITAEELNTPYDEELTYLDILESYFPLFQDVFNEPFSEVEHRIKLFYELDDTRAIGDAKSEMVTLLASSFKANKERTSPIRHTRDIYLDFKDYINGIFGVQVIDLEKIILINTMYPQKAIEDQFKKFLTSIYEKERSHGCPWLQPYYTQGRKDFSAWESSIEAYDIKSNNSKDGKTENALALNITPRAFDKRIESAEDYILRAEKGVFPARLGKKSNVLKKKLSSKSPLTSEYGKISHLIEAKRLNPLDRKVI